MKNLLLLLLLLVPGLCFGQGSIEVGSIDDLNNKSGFRDALFNMPVTAFKNLQLISAAGNEKRYTRKGDKLQIGDFPVKSIVYTFYKSHLSQVTISVATQRNIEGINTSLIVSYGRPEIVDGNFIWSGTRVQLSSIGASDFSKAVVRFLFIPIALEKSADEKKSGIKAATDL